MGISQFRHDCQKIAFIPLKILSYYLLKSKLYLALQKRKLFTTQNIFEKILYFYKRYGRVYFILPLLWHKCLIFRKKYNHSGE
jgi:hypothetical protein